MTQPPPAPVVRDRAVGLVLASAAADALGAPHEFGPALDPATELVMQGGGAFGWEPGEWTDDTQQACAIVEALAAGVGPDALVTATDARLQAWFASDPNDVGSQTRAVMGLAARRGIDLTTATAEWQRANADKAGNGSLMRTGPVALAAPDDLATVARLARKVSALTHANPDALDACVLWSVAIARALNLPTGGDVDWRALVHAGLDYLEADRRSIWAERIDACRTRPPEEFIPNGWVVTAFQAALASMAQTSVPDGQPACLHLQLAIERAVRIGGDTDTVAAIAGSLLGAYWGATAIPYRWRRKLHGRVTNDRPPLTFADLDRQARVAANNGEPDNTGWPTIDSLLPYYRREYQLDPLVAELTDNVLIGNVYAVPDLDGDITAVISLCRIGRIDVPTHIEHHVVGVLDTSLEENPNVDFVLADTADLIAELDEEGNRVFLHCAQAQNRTPTIAAAYLIRHHGCDVDTALARAEAITGTTPQQFFQEALRSLE